MSLQDLLGRVTDEWVEGVAAALYLHDVDLQPGMFDPLYEKSLQELREQLNALPDAWAQELCMEALEHECA